MKTNYAENFKELVKSNGYELLSEYKSAKTKVKIRCNNDHEYKVRPDDFKSGKRCPICAGLCPIQAKKEFKELVESVEYELLEEYKNAITKVKLRCKNGHEYSVLPNSFKRGNRCPVCSGLCPIQAKEQFLDLLIEQERYELLSEYKDIKTKVKIRCDKGHEYSVTPNSFQQGHRCSKCVGQCSIQAKEQFLELLVKDGYELLSEYIDTKVKVKLKCPNDHEWDVIPNNFVSKYSRCPHCAGSTGQRLLQEMLLEYNFGKVIYNDRKVLDGLELDIYYPELSIAIEYQGNYWHSLQKTIINDKRKKKLCKEKGIKLIEVWDDDFLKNSQSISENIYNKINDKVKHKTI